MMSIREARKLIAKLAENDAFRLTKHAKEEMAAEVPELILLDLINVLKSSDSEIRDPGDFTACRIKIDIVIDCRLIKLWW